MLPRHLTYLNLELPSRVRKVNTTDKYKVPCSFEKDQATHIFHTIDNPQFNTLVDLVIAFSDNLEFDLNKQFRTLDIIDKSVKEKNKTIQDLQKNLEFLRTVSNTQETQIRSLKTILEKILFELSDLKNLPSKQDILALSNLIEQNKPKDIDSQSKALILEVKSQVDKNKLEFEKYIKTFEIQLQRIEKLAGE